jgi:NAD(P)-dependent dehydrogenase (short-subunit alcohol dehydrogenase family)
MVLQILYTVGTAILPSEYYTHLAVAVVGIVTVYAFAQGRKTSRERDLHGRTILITAASHSNRRCLTVRLTPRSSQGAFNPNGLTLLNSLAQRGAHIIALTSEPPDTGAPATLVSLLRSTTSNENIYAEHCDLTSPASIRTFCGNYQKSEQRLDAVIFAHEYAPIGNIFSHKSPDLEKQRQTASCATFLVVTLLLPLLLTAPVERDIRIINLVNPFYAAAARVFTASPSSPSSSSPSLFLTEGRRALRTAIFMRHLQRVLDALPSSSQVPRTDVNSQSIPVVSDKAQRSNIVSVSVSPGISRTDVVAPLLAADSSRGSISWLGMIL